MVVWQGLGSFAFVVLFVTGGIAAVILHFAFGPGEDGEQRILALGLLLAAPLVYLFAKRIEARPTRTLIDKETGQEVVLRERHTFFFIPLRYWSVIYLVGGLIAAAYAVAESN